jgi:uncharacterized protein (DUF1501 family)
MVLTAPPPRRIGRRALLGLFGSGSAQQQPIAATPDPDRILVTIFLRGAADGLNLIVPCFEDRYYALRPTLAVPRPDDSRAPEGNRAIDLDGRFGLNPRLSALLPAYREGSLAVVHAVGSDDETRSHFEAQDRMEHAGAAGQSIGSGWLARHLSTRPRSAKTGALSAVAIGTTIPEALRGAPSASAVESIASYRLGDGDRSAFTRALAALHEDRGGAPDLLRAAGRDTLDVLDRLDRLRGDRPPAGGASYPDHDFGRALRQVADLIHADCGLHVAHVDLGPWDSHFVQDTFIPDLMEVLAKGIAAFRADLGEARGRVDVVVMTEFGRRAYENSSLGTDHGRAGAMLVLGDGIAGGRVIADWPGLEEADLTPPGDLRVTIDYRRVLAELVERRLGNPRVDEVFPGLPRANLGLVR